MKTHKSMHIATLLILGVLVILLYQPIGAKSMNAALQEQTIPLPMKEYLGEIGRAYDCFFTIEETWTEATRSDITTNHVLPRPLQMKGLKEELDYLSQVLPNFTYNVDKVNPRLIHIIDKRLTKQDGYSFERVILNINFKGKVNDLPSEIGRLGMTISSPKLLDLREHKDFSTEVEIKGDRLKVRDALSNFVQLEGRRNRILWIARTKLGQGEVSYVHYPM